MNGRRSPELTTDEVRQCEALFDTKQPQGVFYGEGVDTLGKVRTLLAQCGQYISDERLRDVMDAALPQWVPPLGLAQLLRLMTVLKREFTEDPFVKEPQLMEHAEADDAFDYMLQHREVIAALTPLHAADDVSTPEVMATPALPLPSLIEPGPASPGGFLSRQTTAGGQTPRGRGGGFGKYTAFAPTPDARPQVSPRAAPKFDDSFSDVSEPRPAARGSTVLEVPLTPRSRRSVRLSTQATPRGSVPTTPTLAPLRRTPLQSPLTMPGATGAGGARGSKPSQSRKSTWKQSLRRGERVKNVFNAVASSADADGGGDLDGAADTVESPMKHAETSVSKENLQRIVEQFGLAYDVWDELDDEGIAPDSALVDEQEFRVLCNRLTNPRQRQGTAVGKVEGQNPPLKHKLSWRLIRRLSRGSRDAKMLLALRSQATENNIEMGAEDLLRLLDTPSIPARLPKAQRVRTLQLNTTVKKGAHIRREPSSLKTRSQMISDRQYPPYAANGRLHKKDPAPGAYSEWRNKILAATPATGVYQRPQEWLPGGGEVAGGSPRSGSGGASPMRAATETGGTQSHPQQGSSRGVFNRLFLMSKKASKGSVHAGGDASGAGGGGGSALMWGSGPDGILGSPRSRRSRSRRRPSQSPRKKHPSGLPGVPPTTLYTRPDYLQQQQRGAFATLGGLSPAITDGLP